MRGNIDNLPKFAQDEIRRLRKEVEHWKKEASLGPENSLAFANSYSDAPVPLGPDPDVKFILGDKDIRCTIETTHAGIAELVVYGGDALLIQPRSSNVVHIRAQRFGE
jgi:hypothetical protein